MYKLNVELYPYSSKGLSPRYHISKNKFNKIRENKIDELGCMCEACGKIHNRMELHEAATFKNKKYIFDGFFLLCQSCHDLVHCINISCNHLGVTTGARNYTWDIKYEIKKYSRFKTKTEFNKHINNAFDEVFDFMMSDTVTCDYSIAEKYDLDPTMLKSSFDNKYNHFEARIRYVSFYLVWLSQNKEIGIELDQRFYDTYLNPKKAKEYQSVLDNEYIKHKKYYTNNKILSGISSPKRDKVILKYAEIMRKSLM